MSKITKVIARQVFDSRGNPTIEAEVFANNMKARAICPSGASTGKYEAIELRDTDSKRYMGKGVTKAIDNILNIVKPRVLNKEYPNFTDFDREIIDIDGIRIEFDYGWGLVRSSNTQPAIVCRFEAESEEFLEEIKELIFGKIKLFGDVVIDV